MVLKLWRNVLFPPKERRGEGTLVPRELTMKTLGILQGEGFGKLLQNLRPLPSPPP